MGKKKMIIAISIICVVAIIGIIGGVLLYKNYENNKIVSTLTLDINPSIEINLNKKEKVVSVVALNKDAKEIINDDLKGETLDTTLSEITDKIVKKGYAEKGEVVILINVVGNIKLSNVEEKIKTTFNGKEIKATVLTQEISETSKENAEKYNISESKASYIEEILKEHEDLTFEDLKDKSIHELNEIKNPKEDNEVDNKEEDKNQPETNKPDNSGTTNNNGTSGNTSQDNTGSSSGNSGSSGNSSSTKPSVSKNPTYDPQDKSGVWCTWNKNRPQGSTFNYPDEIESSKVSTYALNKLGLTGWDIIGNKNYSIQADQRSSYCRAYKQDYVTKDYIYSVLMDMVTGEFIEESKTPTPKPKCSEEQARDKFLEKHGLTLADVKNENITAYQVMFRYEQVVSVYGDKYVYTYVIVGETLSGTRLPQTTIDANTCEVLKVW